MAVPERRAPPATGSARLDYHLHLRAAFWRRPRRPPLQETPMELFYADLSPYARKVRVVV